MKVLACVPHFYDPGSHGVMGSSQETAESRTSNVNFCIRQLCSLLHSTEFLLGSPGRIANEQVRSRATAVSGDVWICVHSDKHLLGAVTTGVFARPHRTEGDPRLLGFGCRAVFAEHVDDYDLFCFIEDDTAILDPLFFEKAAAFYERFGEERLVVPNRYELFGSRDLAWRTYLDRDHPAHYRFAAERQDEPELRAPGFGRDVVFELTDSVAAGCYVITRGQLRWWMRQDDFLTLDPGLRMDPMEVAQVPLRGRKPAYRPGLSNLAFLGVHHRPNRASHAATPRAKLAAVVGPEIDRRRG